MATSKRLYRAVQQANIEVYDLATVVPELRGMTTTLTAVVVDRGELTAAHIGDSRLYLLRDGRLTQLTKDHTVAGEKARIGLMSKARAREHPDRSVLTRSLGRELIVPIDRISNRLFRGDALLVCSDGLYNVLDEEQMAPLVARGDAGAACRSLIDTANGRGTLDNVSAAVLRVLNGPERPGSPGRPRRQAPGPLHPTRRLKLRPASRKDPAARSIGEVAEWPKAPDSKSGLGASPTWVRLPPSPLIFSGEVSEWPKEHDWKSCVPKGTEGSNPSLSSIYWGASALTRLWPPAPRSLRVAKPRCARLWSGGVGRFAPFGLPCPRSLRVAKPRCARLWSGASGAWALRALWPPAPPLASRGEATLRSPLVGGRRGVGRFAPFGLPCPRSLRAGRFRFRRGAARAFRGRLREWAPVHRTRLWRVATGSAGSSSYR